MSNVQSGLPLAAALMVAADDKYSSRQKHGARTRRRRTALSYCGTTKFSLDVAYPILILVPFHILKRKEWEISNLCASSPPLIKGRQRICNPGYLCSAVDSTFPRIQIATFSFATLLCKKKLYFYIHEAYKVNEINNNKRFGNKIVRF